MALQVLGAMAAQGASQMVGNALNLPIWDYQQDQLLEKQYKYWKKETDYLNAYNTPLNQMGRMKEAGLNPALMYANGGLQNTSASTASVGGVAPMPSNNMRGVSPMEIQQLRTSQEQLKGIKIANEIAEEDLLQKKVETDEKYQAHITNVYTNQNAFREAIAKGGLFFNPAFYTTWQDRLGRYHFEKTSPDYDVDLNDYYEGINGGVRPVTPIQYDPAFMSDYILGNLYKNNGMQSYNTREKAEERINAENERDAKEARLDFENVRSNWDALRELYKLSLNQDIEYRKQTFEHMTNSAIAEFKQSIAKNTLLKAMHEGGFLGNESPLLRFLSNKIGHSGFDSLYGPANYGLVKADALLNAVIQMGADVAGAYLSRGAHRPFNPQKPFNVKRSRRNHKYGYDEITEYGDFGTVGY